MKKKRLILLLVVFCFFTAFLGSKEKGRVRPMEVVGLWWHLNTEWVSPPPEIGLDEKEASATVLLFCPDGEFTMYDCHVVERNGVVSVMTDAMNIYEGKWKRDYTEVSVKYRLRCATILPVGGLKLPGKWKKEKAEIYIRGIKFEGKNFTKFDSIHPQDYEQYFFCTEN